MEERRTTILIWWASSIGGGQLDEPVVGRFEDDGIGRFECDDILDGVHVRVRYVWTVVDEDTLEWEQFFSFDGRRTWDSNWRMQSWKRVWISKVPHYKTNKDLAAEYEKRYGKPPA